MIGMTMCSGIGAPEVAAPWVDWRFASEIEPFPRAVLAERFGYKLPEDHNQGDPLLWGDMTEISPELLRRRGVPLPDLIFAGTPCQAFSIAGSRKGVADDRGNLTLKFVDTCHAIVDDRPDGKLIVVWENVPGVLSDANNAFGCFLGGLVGADDPIFPSPKPAKGKSTDFWKWHKAKHIDVTDEDGNETGEVITVKEHHKLSWPSEGMVEGPRGRATWRVLDAQYFGVPQRRRRVFVVVDFGGGIDPAEILFERQGLHGNTPPRREAGQGASGGARSGASHWSGGPHPSLNQSSNTGGIGSSNQEIFSQQGAGIVAAPLDPAQHYGDQDEKDARQITARRTAIGGYLIDEVASTIRQRDHKESTDLVIAFDCKAGGKTGLAIGDAMTALRGEGHGGGHAAVAYSIMPQNSGKDYKAREVDVAQPLMAGGPVGGNQGGDFIVEVAMVFDENQITNKTNGSIPRPEVSHTLPAAKCPPTLFQPTVRRLMPLECARLQGFPDDHCSITYRGKPAPDGQIYKAYGNSMAEPVVRWIMDRIREATE